jgi:hypothetical protein
MILGIVAGVALVGFLLFNLLGGGGGEEAAPPTETTGPTTGPTTAPSPTVSPTPSPRETLPPETLAGDRDPFSIPPALSPSPSGSVSPSPSGTGSPSPSGTGSPSPSGTGSPSPTTSPSPGPDSSATVGGHEVTLLDIFAGHSKAQVEVDGTVYTVEEGSTFDDNFRLVNISGDCGRFTWGDEAFTLCLNPQK